VFYTRRVDGLPSRSTTATSPQFQVLFEAAPEHALVVTADLVIAEVSDAYLEATMTTRADIIGRHLFEVFPDIETEVVQRSRELQAANERLVELDQAKSEFLSRMSHELRTPLNAIIGFAQLLTMDELSTTQRQSVQDISRAGTHLLDLINDLLDIARTEHIELIDRDAADRSHDAAPAAPSPVAPSDGAIHPLTVLYIEDNPSNLRLIERVFEIRGDVSLITATSGRLGTELAEARQPDLVLLDLHLPDIDGDEVLVQLRANERTAHLPIAIISADATPGQIMRLKQLGADEYFTKPIDIEELLRYVQQLAHRS